jgi:hypothetical protein
MKSKAETPERITAQYSLRRSYSADCYRKNMLGLCSLLKNHRPWSSEQRAQLLAWFSRDRKDIYYRIAQAAQATLQQLVYQSFLSSGASSAQSQTAGAGDPHQPVEQASRSE